MDTRSRRRLPVVALAALALVAGCTSSRRTSGTGPTPRPAIGSDAAPDLGDLASLHYGAAPTSNPNVTYQPDVVIVGRGGGSIRSVTDGGLTYRLDPAAHGASELAVGKVMFVTGRGVGRVIDQRRDGADLMVTVVPVPFTDVIKDGTFTGTGPVSLTNPLAYDAADPFWAGSSPDSDTENPIPEVPGANFAPPGGGSATLPVPRLGGKASATIQGFQVSASCCASGASLRFAYDDGGVRLLGTFTLELTKPTASFNLAITDGRVTKASLKLLGGIGLKTSIEGATQVLRTVDKLIPIPTDFNVPFANILGVPLSATMTQLLAVHTAFSSKDGNIKAHGEWGISGGLGFSYANNTFHVSAPTALMTRSAILDSIEGISTGAGSISLTYQTRVTVGIGAFGFVAGLFFFFSVHLYLVRGSALGAQIVCNIAQIQLDAKYGIGYSIPKPVADLVNFFLAKFGSRPIERSGGLESDFVSFRKTAYQPDSSFCRS